jgi:hypothetical protein
LKQQADQTYIYTADIEFASPSAAAAVTLDRNANGRVEWRVRGTGQTLQAWQVAQLPVSAEG